MKKWLSLFSTALFVLLISLPIPIMAKPAALPTIPPLTHYVVNSLNDPGTGVCDDTECTLREAITAANGASTTLNVPITFSVTGAIQLTSSLPDLNRPSGPTSITGPTGPAGIIISGYDTYRILDIRSGTQVTLKNLTFFLGHAPAGVFGGAFSTNGTVTVDGCTFWANRSDDGGAIYAGGGSLIVQNSTFLNNQADTKGGAIHNAFANPLRIINSTFIGNTAPEGAALSTGSGYGISVDSSTITGNTATSGAVITASNGSISLHNTIVSNTPATTNCSDHITDLGNNIDNGISCGWVTGSPGNKGSLSSTNPQLLSLARNGGQTQTIALKPSSPAVDAVTYESSNPPTCQTTDQRGYPRPVDGNDDGTARCDIGAYELQLMVYLPLVVR